MAARDVFLQKGMTGARMQEIANRAGINKALLHYYYRNKELLFQAVFQDVLKEMFPRFFAIFQEDVPLEVKVYQLADSYITFLLKNPQMPHFLLNEVQRDPKQLMENLEISKVLDISVIQKQLEVEYQEGRIRKIGVDQFMLNVVSMMVFPFIVGPMFQMITDMNEERYHALLLSRKKEVPKFIMNALRP